MRKAEKMSQHLLKKANIVSNRKGYGMKTNNRCYFPQNELRNQRFSSGRLPAEPAQDLELNPQSTKNKNLKDDIYAMYMCICVCTL